MVNPTNVVQTGGSSTDSILEDLTARMTKVLTKNQTQPTYRPMMLPLHKSALSWMAPTMPSGPNLLRCISRAKTNWDISMVTFCNLNLQIWLSDDGELRMQLSKGGWSILWTRPWSVISFASQLQNWYGILLLLLILMELILHKYMI